MKAQRQHSEKIGQKVIIIGHVFGNAYKCTVNREATAVAVPVSLKSNRVFGLWLEEI